MGPCRVEMAARAVNEISRQSKEKGKRFRFALFYFVIPAQAGIQTVYFLINTWTPACAGVTFVSYTNFAFFSGKLRTGLPVAA